MYFDCCCLNRPFDDQSNPLVNLEAYAVRNLLALCERKVFVMITSEVLRDEIDAIPDLIKREKVKALESIAVELVRLNDKLIERAKYFESLKIGAYDALYLACAEEKADIFFTVDKKLLKKTKKIYDLKIEVWNPIRLLEKFYES